MHAGVSTKVWPEAVETPWTHGTRAAGGATTLDKSPVDVFHQTRSSAAQMGERGAARAAGDAVDAWHEGGWWQSRVTAEASAATSARRPAGRRGSRASAADAPLWVVPDSGGEELRIPQVLLSHNKSTLKASYHCQPAV